MIKRSNSNQFSRSGFSLSCKNCQGLFLLKCMYVLFESTNYVIIFYWFQFITCLKISGYYLLIGSHYFVKHKQMLSLSNVIIGESKDLVLTYVRIYIKVQVHQYDTVDKHVLKFYSLFQCHTNLCSKYLRIDFFSCLEVTIPISFSFSR